MIVKVNIFTGAELELVYEPKLDIESWLIDRDGDVRLGIRHKKDELQFLSFDDATESIIGLRIEEEKRKTIWFDERFKKYQKMIDKHRPEHENRIFDWYFHAWVQFLAARGYNALSVPNLDHITNGADRSLLPGPSSIRNFTTCVRQAGNPSCRQEKRFQDSK